MSENNMAEQNPETSSELVATPTIRQSSEKYCHACAAVLHVSATFCPKCGAPQSTAMLPAETIKPAIHIQDGVFCRGCGQQIHKTAHTCPKCGAVQAMTNSIAPGGKDRLTAGLLGIFLGAFGAHKFYLGKPFQGMLYFIFFWAFIPAIIGFIEGVYYLTLSDGEFAQGYGKPK